MSTFLDQWLNVPQKKQPKRPRRERRLANDSSPFPRPLLRQASSLRKKGPRLDAVVSTSSTAQSRGSQSVEPGVLSVDVSTRRPEADSKSNPLKGLQMCLSGTFTTSKAALEGELVRRGATCQPRLTGSCTHLVIPNYAHTSNKVTAARRNRQVIWDEQKVRNLIRQYKPLVETPSLSSSSSSSSSSSVADASLQDKLFQKGWNLKKMKILATTPGKTTRGNRDVVHQSRQHTWTGKAAFYDTCVQIVGDLLIFCSRASKEDVQIYVGAAQDLEAARRRQTCHVSGSSNVGAAAKGDIAFPKNIETHFMAMEVMGDVHGKKLEHFGFYATRDAGYTQWGKEHKLGHKFKAAPGCVVYFQIICSSSARIKGLKKTDGLKRVVRKPYHQRVVRQPYHHKTAEEGLKVKTKTNGRKVKFSSGSEVSKTAPQQKRGQKVSPKRTSKAVNGSQVAKNNYAAHLRTHCKKSPGGKSWVYRDIKPRHFTSKTMKRANTHPETPWYYK